MSYLNYSDWAEQSRSFEALGALRMHDFTLTGRGEPALVVAGDQARDRRRTRPRTGQGGRVVHR